MHCSNSKRFLQSVCNLRALNYIRFSRAHKSSILTKFNIRCMSSESVTPLSITPKRKQVQDSDPSSIENSEKTIAFLDRSDFFEKYPPKSLSLPRQAWVESLDSTNNESRDMVSLHPDVWGIRPRIDVLWSNIDWQKRYKTVLYNDVKDRYDLHEGPRPWPRKGGGKARHSSTASPIWKQGGKAHGPRGPRTDFYMLGYTARVTGLIHALSAKFAQDDVRIVQTLEIPSDEQDYIENLIETRGWGISTLFVDKNDIFPRNLTAATGSIFHANMMPVAGLNVYSMLKHKTLVLSLEALMQIEEKLMFGLSRTDIAEKCAASSTSGKRI